MSAPARAAAIRALSGLLQLAHGRFERGLTAVALVGRAKALALVPADELAAAVVVGVEREHVPAHALAGHGGRVHQLLAAPATAMLGVDAQVVEPGARSLEHHVGTADRAAALVELEVLAA